jgi:uncharacterized membrane protein YdjX (TVP38/TMEM64 family)
VKALRVLVVVVVALVALIAIHHWGPAIFERIAGLGDDGPVGGAVFALLFAGGGLLMLPASWFQGAAAFLWGPAIGVPVAWLLSTLTSALAFELARSGMRERVIVRLGTGRLAALDRAIARRGFVAVVLLRISPLAPYNVVSYGIGVTAVPRATFWAGNALGSLVPATAWGLVGASLRDLAALTTGEAGFGNARWVVLGITVAASVGLALFVRRALDEPEPLTPPA